MNYLIFLTLSLVSFFISVFAMSNILLPIFYIIPRIQREKNNDNLKEKIPLRLIILPPIVWSSFLGLIVYLSHLYIPEYIVAVYIGIGLSLLGLLRRIGRKNSDMNQDFINSFGKYLKDGNPPKQPDIKILKGLLAVNLLKENHENIIKLSDKILETQNNDIDTLTLRAQSFEKTNFNLDAIDDYLKIISINESEGNSFGQLGMLYLKLGEIEKGIFYIKASISKGVNTYEPMLQIVDLISDDAKKILVANGNTSENLKRRNKALDDDSYNEHNLDKFLNELIGSKELIEKSLKDNPNAQNLKEILEFINRIDQ